MSIEYSVRRKSTNEFPICFQLAVVFVCFQILSRLQVSNKTVSVIQNQADAVVTVAWSADYLAEDTDLSKKCPALLTGDNRRMLFIDRFIKVNGKTSDFNPGMKENTLFPRSFFFVELARK